MNIDLLSDEPLEMAKYIGADNLGKIFDAMIKKAVDLGKTKIKAETGKDISRYDLDQEYDEYSDAWLIKCDYTHCGGCGTERIASTKISISEILNEEQSLKEYSSIEKEREGREEAEKLLKEKEAKEKLELKRKREEFLAKLTQEERDLLK